MKIAYVRNIEIRCSLPVLLLLPVFAVFGKLGQLCISIFSLALHEISHATMAERLGCRVNSIDIQPFGFIARLNNSPSTPSESAAISAAGPLVSLLLSFAGAGLMQLFPLSSAGLQEFVAFNLSIGLVNLFPVLPLDGGRLLLALFERRIGRSRAVRILSSLGSIFGLMLTALGIILLKSNNSGDGIDFSMLTPAFTGFFIMLAAFSELKTAGTSQVRVRIAAESRLRHGGSLPVNAVAMSENTSVRDALRCISGSGYNLIIAVDSAYRRRGIVDEGELISATMDGNTSATIYSIICNSETKATSR